MKLQLFIFKCAKCGTLFKSPKIGFDSYGEFLLRSIGNAEKAYLDAMADKTYDEVHDLLKANVRIAHKKPNALAEVLRKSYGAIACDPDEKGEVFEIGGFPKCPSCGSQEMECWEETDPPEIIEETLNLVTHLNWSSLSDDEKKIKVDTILLSLGY